MEILMSSVNKAILVGNVGQAPTIHQTKDGKKIASFSVATSESWKDKNGQKKQQTEWHKIAVYNESLVSFIESYVTSGTKIYVEGQIKTTKYQDKQGIEKSQTEIVLSKFKGEIKILSSKVDSDDKGKADNSPPPPSYDMNDEEIPF